MDINRLKTADDVLLFCVRTKARSLADIAKNCRVYAELVRQHFISKDIDFAVVKQHLKKIDFIDYHPWWKDQYLLEEGEEAKLYAGKYWITNYGTVLTKRFRQHGGHTYEKFIALKPKICDGYYQIGLYYQKPPKYVFIHKMVAEVWLTKPSNGSYVKHKNGNTLDNHFWNLSWAC